MTLLVIIFALYFGYLLYVLHRRALARRAMRRRPVFFSLYQQ